MAASRGISEPDERWKKGRKRLTKSNDIQKLVLIWLPRLGWSRNRSDDQVGVLKLGFGVILWNNRFGNGVAWGSEVEGDGAPQIPDSLRRHINTYFCCTRGRKSAEEKKKRDEGWRGAVHTLFPRIKAATRLQLMASEVRSPTLG